MTFGKIKLSIKKFPKRSLYIGLIFLAILAVISIGVIAANSCPEPQLVKDYAKLQDSKDIVIQNDGYLIFKGPIEDVVKINLQKSEGGSQIIYCFDYEDDCPVGCQDVDDVCVVDRNGNILYKDNFFWGNANSIPETRVDVKAGDVLEIDAYTIWYLGLEIWKQDVCEPEPVCEDSDEDGFSVTGRECGLIDCDDNDASVHPGAVELCDWVDNNCDGTIDNNENCVVACSSNAQCGTNDWINGLFCQSNDVYQNFKSFMCNLAGTYTSYCSNNVVAQLKTDCREDYCGVFGENYCKSGDVYHSRTCHDKGCSSGNCFDNETQDEQLVQDCSYGCLLGQCLFEPPVITCNNNSECDDGDNYTEDSCVNPGQEDSYCEHEQIICLTKAECGTDGYINQPVCSNGNVVQDYKTFTCQNAGTPSSSCSNSTAQQIKQTCQYRCENGTCLPQPVQCTTNAECNSLDNYSDDYCSSGDVYKNFNDYSCEQGSCVKDTTKQLVEECDSDETCSAGECEAEDDEEDEDNDKEDSILVRGFPDDKGILEPLSQGTGQNKIYLAPEAEEKEIKAKSNLWWILIWIFGALVIIFLILIISYSRR